MSSPEPTNTHAHADTDGHLRLASAACRTLISRDPDSHFAAESGRYALYINYGCPWAHRTILVRALKRLGDIVQIITTDFDLDLTPHGWMFTGTNGSAERDPLYGFPGLKQIYLEAGPQVTGRYTVPCLWDEKTETVVNNGSSEIMHMLYSAFDDLLPPALREANKNGGQAGFLPLSLQTEIEQLNDWVYNIINIGVYKVGLIPSQRAYDANI